MSTDTAPATPPASPGPAAPTSTTPTDAPPPAADAKPAASKAQLDYERRMEEVLGVERAAKEAQRQADIKLKQAQDLESKLARYKTIQERLDKGEQLEEVAFDIYGDRLNDDLLLGLATKLAEKQKATTPEEVFERKWAAKQLEQAEKEKEKADREEAEKRTLDEKAQAESDQQWNDYLVRSAKVLVERAADFPLCDSLGVNPLHFGAVVEKFVDDNKRLPEPGEVYTLLEAEHEAKLAKAGRSKKSAEKAPGLSIAPPKPMATPRGPEPAPTTWVDPVEEQRALLRAYDQEKRNQAALGRRA